MIVTLSHSGRIYGQQAIQPIMKTTPYQKFLLFTMLLLVISMFVFS